MISVTEYLRKLEQAKRSPSTIKGYGKVFKSFAEYLEVPIDDLHRHLTSDNIAGYATMRIKKGNSPAGTQTNLRILHGFYKLNGVIIAALDMEIIKNPGVQDENDEEDISDKPLTHELLQKMLDQGNPHSRSIITFLTSTGARAGEASKLVLSNIGRLEGDNFISDINGSVVKIPDKIAKGRVKKGKKTGGGYVFLTSEARQYLSDWLKERDSYLKDADARTKGLRYGPKPPEGTKKKDDNRPHVTRPLNDQRIWGVSYTSMHRIWDRLYNKVDGETGTYRARCTMHSCRKFFRTNAVKTMDLDLVEKIMRHSGYLTSEYVRIPDMEKQFKNGEAALFVTRVDHRIQISKLDALQRDNATLQERLNQVEQVQTSVQSASKEITKALTPEQKKTVLSSMSKEELLSLMQELADSK